MNIHLRIGYLDTVFRKDFIDAKSDIGSDGKSLIIVSYPEIEDEIQGAFGKVRKIRRRCRLAEDARIVMSGINEEAHTLLNIGAVGYADGDIFSYDSVIMCPVDEGGTQKGGIGDEDYGVVKSLQHGGANIDASDNPFIAGNGDGVSFTNGLAENNGKSAGKVLEDTLETDTDTHRETTRNEGKTGEIKAEGVEAIKGENAPKKATIDGMKRGEEGGGNAAVFIAEENFTHGEQGAGEIEGNKDADDLDGVERDFTDTEAEISDMLK